MINERDGHLHAISRVYAPFFLQRTMGTSAALPKKVDPAKQRSAAGLLAADNAASRTAGDPDEGCIGRGASAAAHRCGKPNDGFLIQRNTGF
jgi:hypothetical protein